MGRAAMNFCKPYGDPTTAEILVIGHAPRLQRSTTEAQYAFFMDYLENSEPSKVTEKRKYDLAKSTYLYIRHLTGDKLSLGNMYFTNICNEFQERSGNKSTMLIPNDLANKGIREIENTLLLGSFKVIVPMSLQVFYHLVRTGFINNGTEDKLKIFLTQSQPIAKANEKGIYKATVQSSFLLVCGCTIYHGKVPVMPVVQVMKWTRISKDDIYYIFMQQAIVNIQKALQSP
jgi:hypothetical protein